MNRPMKIGYLGAVPFNLIFGGGETQLLNTMKVLINLEVDVTFWNSFDKNYKCDILHIFGCHYWLFQIAYLAKMAQSLYKMAFNPELLFRKILKIRSINDIKFYFKLGKEAFGRIKDFKK